MTVISVHPHFSSISDAANPTGPAPTMTADFLCTGFKGTVADVLTEVDTVDRVSALLAVNNAVAIEVVNAINSIFAMQ